MGDETRAASRPGSDRVRRRCNGWAAALLCVFAGLLLHGAWTVGPTYDEHYYAASGYAYWQEGEFSLNREHPPLLKLLAGAPLLAFDDLRWPEHALRRVDAPAAFFYRWNAPTLDRNLFAARLPLVLLSVLGALALYRVGGRLFGPPAGLAALVLFAFNPNVLAHGRLATLDMGCGVLVFLAAASFGAALERPDAKRTLAAGVLFGLAQATKFTALLTVPLFAAVAVAVALARRSGRPLRTGALVVLVGLSVFAATYGFEARSLNEAWAHPAYVVAGGEEREVPTPAELAGRLAAAFPESEPLGEARRLRVERAHDTGAAVVKLVEYLEEGEPALARAARDVLAGLRHDAESVRKQAFGELLVGAREVTGRPERVALLREVSGRELADLDAARAFYSRYAGESWDEHLFSTPLLARGLPAVFGGRRPVPLLSALIGLDYQLAHSGGGHLSYYDGRVLGEADFQDGNPHPEYYAVVLGAKNPPLFLALVLVGLVLCAVPRRGWTPLRAALLAGFPLLAFAVFSRSNLLMGVKYLLPIFPFLALLGARAAARWPRTALFLAGLAAVEGVAHQPHQLMYYSPLVGGAAGGPELTIVGDDWGQGVRAVGRFYARNREAIDRTGGLYYEPYSAADPAAFGLEDAHRVHGHPQGIVAVHLADYYRQGERYRWLDDYEPFRVLDRSVLLFDTRGGPPGRAAFPGGPQPGE